MAIAYRFLDRDDDTLIATSQLPVEGGIAVAVRTTGYEAGEDEIVQMAIVDFDGNELFAQTVKPQNIDEWSDETASGGIMPADVADSPELFQFEDQIIELFENASIVVGQHVDFIHEMVEASWVSLPACEEYDLSREFCASHCTLDYPNQAAAAAALPGICSYYNLDCDESTTTAIARSVAACYVKLVQEHADERSSKGAAHWEAYERRKKEEYDNDVQAREADRVKAVKTMQINAMLWLCAFVIFANLAVQLGVRGFDFGFVAIAAAAGVFTAVRCIISLIGLYRLRKR